MKTKGLNFPENGVYTQNNIIEISRDYMIKAGIALALVLVYLMIRFNKLGVVKTALISLAVVVWVQVLTIAIIVITRMPIDRMFFAILLLGFALTTLALTAFYEKKLKTE